jgi:hypothetical protein
MNYGPENIQYTVQAGDSLGNLAYEFNTTPEAILATNLGTTPGNLTVGQVLSIPTDWSVNTEQFRRFGYGRPFFRGPFGFGGFRRPFFRGPWGYGPSWGGYPYWW